MKKGVSPPDLYLNKDNILEGADAKGRPVIVSLDKATATNLRAVGLFSDAARPGEVMPDGSIYAGISPTVHRPFFIAACSPTGLLDWDNANEHAKNKNAHGHNDWELPSIEELKDISCRSFAKLAFGKSNKSTGALFWSSEKSPLSGAKHLNMRNKKERMSNRSNKLSVLCVRYMRSLN